MSQAWSLEKPPAERREATRTRSVCLLSSANWDIHLRRMSDVCSASAGVATKFQAPPFGQYRILLNDESSDLRQSKFDFYIFAERIEDFAGPFQTLDASAIAMIREKFADFLAEIRHFRELADGRFLVNNFAPVRPFS